MARVAPRRNAREGVTDSKTGGKKMYKLSFFVHVEDWHNGGYENTHYFLTKRAALEWLAKPWNACASLLSLVFVSKKQAAEDIILPL